MLVYTFFIPTRDLSFTPWNILFSANNTFPRWSVWFICFNATYWGTILLIVAVGYKLFPAKLTDSFASHSVTSQNGKSSSWLIGGNTDVLSTVSAPSRLLSAK